MARRTVSNGELYLAMESLDPLDLRIIREFFGFGQSPSSDGQIGEGLCIDRQRVQYRRVRALQQLRTILEAQNV